MDKIIVTAEALRGSVWVTDEPDPNCPWCKGRGTIGGCAKPVCKHMHTYSFCKCVNERLEDPDADTGSH